MAEDEDIEQDSEEYRKWRQGDDKEHYASSRTPAYSTLLLQLSTSWFQGLF